MTAFLPLTLRLKRHLVEYISNDGMKHPLWIELLRQDLSPAEETATPVAIKRKGEESEYIIVVGSSHEVLLHIHFVQLVAKSGVIFARWNIPLGRLRRTQVFPLSPGAHNT